MVDPVGVRARWTRILGTDPGILFTDDAADRGLVEIAVAGASHEPFEIGTVRFVFIDEEENG
jgi:hypothetical protein